MSLTTGAYRCLLGEGCRALATVQLADADGAETRGCFRHADEVLRSLVGGRVVWSKTSTNEWARKALELSAAR